MAKIVSVLDAEDEERAWQAFIDSHPENERTAQRALSFISGFLAASDSIKALEKENARLRALLKGSHDD